MLQQHLMEVKEISNSFHLNKNCSKVKNFTMLNKIMNNNKNNLYTELYKFLEKHVLKSTCFSVVYFLKTSIPLPRRGIFLRYLLAPLLKYLASHIYSLLNSYTFFKFINGILCNWECFCDRRPDCHHKMLAGLQTLCLTS